MSASIISPYEPLGSKILSRIRTAKPKKAKITPAGTTSDVAARNTAPPVSWAREIREGRHSGLNKGDVTTAPPNRTSDGENDGVSILVLCG